MAVERNFRKRETNAGLRWFSLGILVAVLVLAQASPSLAGAPVTLVKDGKAQMSILSGSAAQAAEELQKYLKQISGAELKIEPAREDANGVYVGLVSDFPWLRFENTGALGPEGFILRSDGKNLYLVANTSRGVGHAVTTLLQTLGARWFFPGKVWEVIPTIQTVVVALEERQTPSFPTQRTMWYGYGAYAPCKRDYDEWMHHNRMGGPMEINIGHTWYGIDRDAEFQKHPEWFALVEGKRKKSKPCYTHPEVIQRAIEYALAAAKEKNGKGMVSLTPPDGLGYCECERCFSVFRGGTPQKMKSAWYAKRPDGVLVNVISETLFNFANKVAIAVTKKYPDMMVGSYAYSAYSHPASFRLHPNVYVQTTTEFRRTPLTLEEQLNQWGQMAKKVDIRGYWSVYQWDWDNPTPGRMVPEKLQEQFRFFRRNNVAGVNSEACNNWGVRGLGYYAAAQLLWNVDADVEEMVQDFYERAFGPAAKVMQRYYERWRDVPKGYDLVENLKLAYRDLDEAMRLVGDKPAYRDRLDHLRMYMHYIFLRSRVSEAAKAGDKQGIIDAVKAETIFGGRLTYTNMLHSRPLIVKAFHRRFKKHMDLLKDIPEAQKDGAWRQVGEPPSREELEMLWAQDKASLGL